MNNKAMEGRRVADAKRRSDFVSGELLRARWSSLEQRRRWRLPRSILVGVPVAITAIVGGLLLSPRGDDVGSSPRPLAVTQPAPLPVLRRVAPMAAEPRPATPTKAPITSTRLAELEAWYQQLELELARGGTEPGMVIHHSLTTGYYPYWHILWWSDAREWDPAKAKLESVRQLRDLRSGNPRVRSQAQRALLSKPEYWHDPSFIENCVEALRDDDISRNMMQTVTWFENFPDQIAEAREYLIKGMWSQDPQLEFNSAYLLSFLEPGEELPRTCAILINHLQDNTIAWDAVVAAEALGRIGPRTVPYLQAAYPGHDEQQLSIIEHLLGHFSDDPRGWRRTIILGVLGSKDPVTRPAGAGDRNSYWQKR
ncbi:MAG: hypothetical protein MK085_00555 [Phycisphaerales bacterium]|nr:hypothetical protein [Phycisphaerales bacterium]